MAKASSLGHQGRSAMNPKKGTIGRAERSSAISSGVLRSRLGWEI